MIWHFEINYGHEKKILIIFPPDKLFWKEKTIKSVNGTNQKVFVMKMV